MSATFVPGRLDEVDPIDWTLVCRMGALTPDRGVTALIDGRQIAVFLLSNGELHAIDDVDPCSGAAVLSRGLVGDVDGLLTVATPTYEQRFDLRTGRCLDVDGARVAVHRVAVVDEHVVVQVRA